MFVCRIFLFIFYFCGGCGVIKMLLNCNLGKMNVLLWVIILFGVLFYFCSFLMFCCIKVCESDLRVGY